MNHMDLLISVALGIGLAAATGFRLFVPLLVLALAAWTGHVHLAASFAWLGTPPAIAMLGVAAVAEVSAYYVPGVDHLLDVIAAPAALVAGTVAAAAVITDLPPLVKWTTAVIAGGGAAGLTQGMTTLLRAKSTIATGGLGNPLVASGELGGALGISLLAISMPFVAVALVVL
ncbi:MAG: DUF4126 domain-containing protein, partial [Steroidobacteraceae bacterium]